MGILGRPRLGGHRYRGTVDTVRVAVRAFTPRCLALSLA